jgi:hypothetical protein
MFYLRMPGISSPVATSAPGFTPVPRRARRDGWTDARQQVFIAELARTGCVRKAALAAGMSRESAYRLRRRAGAESFAAAWDSILAARPRGTSSPALVWHRLVRKAGGRGAVRVAPRIRWSGRCFGGRWRASPAALSERSHCNSTRRFVNFTPPTPAQSRIRSRDQSARPTISAPVAMKGRGMESSYRPTPIAGAAI